MALSFRSIVFMTMLFLSIQSCTVLSKDFEVGGKDGWAIPSKNQNLFDDWASDNRFRINDTLNFVYAKDSVLEVTKDDFDKCRSAHPEFYSNNGNTSYTFARSGLFFFISGVSGHCERGLRMIVKVLEEPASHPPAQSANDTSAPPSPPSPSSAGTPSAAAAAMIVFFIFSLFGVVPV